MLSKRNILVGAVISVFSIGALASDCRKHTDLGTPAKSDQILCRQGFAVGYSYAHKAPEWVAYELTLQSVSTEIMRKKNAFSVDRDILEEHRTALAEYRDSGYDLGQMAPANSMDFSNKVLKESFLLSNVIPQKPSFNRGGSGPDGVWGALEDYVRRWAVTRNGIYVVSGPVYETVIDVVGNGIQVPSHFYKVIYDPEYMASIAFLVPHAKKPAARLPGYVTTIDCIESLTGLDFLGSLDDDDEADVENGTAYNFDYWSMRDGNTKPASCPSR